MQRRRLAWRRDDNPSLLEAQRDDRFAMPEETLQALVDGRLDPYPTSLGSSALLASACPLCSYAMTTSACAPYLCCPCGHSICLRCAPKLSADGSRCPSCNACVVCTYPNVALQQVLASDAATNDDYHNGRVQSVAPHTKPPSSLTKDFARCVSICLLGWVSSFRWMQVQRQLPSLQDAPPGSVSPPEANACIAIFDCSCPGKR